MQLKMNLETSYKCEKKYVYCELIEDQWWTARNSLGQTGQIPVPYIELVSAFL
jgi:hypothetical protein